MVTQRAGAARQRGVSRFEAVLSGGKGRDKWMCRDVTKRQLDVLQAAAQARGPAATAPAIRRASRRPFDTGPCRSPNSSCGYDGAPPCSRSKGVQQRKPLPTSKAWGRACGLAFRKGLSVSSDRRLPGRKASSICVQTINAIRRTSYSSCRRERNRLMRMKFSIVNWRCERLADRLQAMCEAKGKRVPECGRIVRCELLKLRHWRKACRLGFTAARSASSLG